MPYRDTYLVFDLLENQKQVLGDYEYAANYDDCPQCPIPIPSRLRLPALLKSHPPKILTLLQQQHPLYLHTHHQIRPKHQKLNKPKLAQRTLAGLIENKQQDGCDELREQRIVIDIHVQFCILLAELIDEEDDGEEEVHEDYEGVDVVIVDYDAYQEVEDVAHAEEDHEAEATRQSHQVERVLELEILVGQHQLLEQEEEDAVDKDTELVLHTRVDYRSEEIHVVCHQEPLEDQHVVHVLRTQRRPVCSNDQRLRLVSSVHMASGYYYKVMK